MSAVTAFVVIGCGGFVGKPEKTKISAAGMPDGATSHETDDSTQAIVLKEGGTVDASQIKARGFLAVKFSFGAGAVSAPTLITISAATSLASARLNELAGLDFSDAASASVRITANPATAFARPGTLSVGVTLSVVEAALPASLSDASSAVLKPFVVGLVVRNDVVNFIIIPTSSVTVSGDVASFPVGEPGVFQVFWAEGSVSAPDPVAILPVSALQGGLGTLEVALGITPVFDHAEGPAANVCLKHTPARKTGELDRSLVSESSGIYASEAFPGRLYHINDGSVAAFYVSRMDGAGLTKVRVDGFEPKDIEFLAHGKCFGTKKCLFLGDTGDNELNRDEIQIALIEEVATFGASVTPLAIIKYAAPKRDIEAGAVNPATGDLHMIAKLNPKEAADRVDLVNKTLKDPLLRAYRARSSDFAAAFDGMRSLEDAGKYDFPLMATTPTPNLAEISASWFHFDPTGAAPSPLLGKFVTDMTFNDDGKKLLIMTYSNAVEAKIDLAATATPSFAALPLGVDANIITIKALPQQEAVSYVDGGKGFIYTSEFVPGISDIVPIMRVDCADPAPAKAALQPPSEE